MHQMKTQHILYWFSIPVSPTENSKIQGLPMH